MLNESLGRSSMARQDVGKTEGRYAGASGRSKPEALKMSFQLVADSFSTGAT